MYKIDESVRTTFGKDGAIVLDIRRSRMIRLNVTGSFVLQQVEEGQTEGQIVEGLSAHFHVARKTAETDVNEFLSSLQQEGLIHFHQSVVS